VTRCYRLILEMSRILVLTLGATALQAYDEGTGAMQLRVDPHQLVEHSTAGLEVPPMGKLSACTPAAAGGWPCPPHRLPVQAGEGRRELPAHLLAC